MHIGKLIREVIKAERININKFAEEICCSRTNVYKIFEKSSIDTEMLNRISKALNHDFFKYYSENLAAEDDDVSNQGT